MHGGSNHSRDCVGHSEVSGTSEGMVDMSKEEAKGF